MQARLAAVSDAAEVVRLARLMFESMGLDASDQEWQARGENQVRARLGHDLAIFVVEDPARPGHLVAAAAGTIATRLAVPSNPSGRVGYVQWVATEESFRRQGLGRQVMEALMAWYQAQQVPIVELHATTAGESLYRTLGFAASSKMALRRQALA